MVCFNKIFVSKQIKGFLFVLFSLFNLHIFSAVLVKGDSTADNQSFTFGTGEYAIDAVSEYFYITSKQDGAQEFTVSRFKAFESAFKPLCPEQVEMLGESGVQNPIYNKGIKFFSLMDMKKDGGVNSYPVLVANDSLNKIYVLDLSKYFGKLYEEKTIDLSDLPDKTNLSSNKCGSNCSSCGNCNNCGTCEKEINNTGSCSVKISKISVIPFDNILNSAGNPITEINGIASSASGYIFAGVDIGTAGGGIAIMRLAMAHGVKNQSIEEFKASEELAALEAGKKSPEDSINKSQNNKNNKSQDAKNKNITKTFLALFGASAKSLYIDTSVAKITSDLASIAFSDIYWDNHLDCLFIALKTQANTAGTDGCKALVLGKVDASGVLTLKDFAPDAVFSGQNQIVGAVAANSQVSLHKVRTMLTSNRLSYVIVLGKNGTDAATKKSVFALPLVFAPGDEDNCMLANKNSLPIDTFNTSAIIKKFTGRTLTGKATTTAQTYTLNDDEVRVGFGDLGSDISNIFVVGDAVFALVKSPANNGNGGLFISRALFDQYGKVKRWTQWENISSSTAPIFGASLNSVYGDFILMSGADANNVNTVKRTIWSEGDENGIKDLSIVIGKEFPKNIAGVQGLFEFPYSSLGVPYGMDYITLLVTTGYKKVVLTELAKLDTGVLVRNTGNFSNNLQTFNGGQITANFPISGARVVSISGGVLDKIGAIEAATVTNVGANNGRLFVGGVNGLAVLVDNSGNGWTTGLGPNFAGLTNTMAFRTSGNFTFIRKLVQDGNYLYILTDNKLYRSDLTSGSNNFVTGALDYTELANYTSFVGLTKYSSFLDFVVSGKLGILATSNGLFRISNGQDISAGTLNSINWTQVPVPTALGPIKQLFTVSSTLKEQDVATQANNGVLYALSSYFGNDSAQYNRFTINYSSQINDNTIMPLPDYYIQSNLAGVGANSYFMNFGEYRNILQDQGAIRYVSQDRNLSYSPILSILMPGLLSGLTLPETQSKTLSIGITDDSEIVRILRSSTGPVILAGDFGFKINE